MDRRLTILLDVAALAGVPARVANVAGLDAILLWAPADGWAPPAKEQEDERIAIACVELAEPRVDDGGEPMPESDPRPHPLADQELGLEEALGAPGNDVMRSK